MTTKELNYVISKMFPRSRVSDRWPGVQLHEDDGLFVRHSFAEMGDFLYVVASYGFNIERGTGEFARLIVTLPDPRAKIGDAVYQVEGELIARLDAFWKDMNPYAEELARFAAVLRVVAEAGRICLHCGHRR